MVKKSPNCLRVADQAKPRGVALLRLRLRRCGTDWECGNGVGLQVLRSCLIEKLRHWTRLVREYERLIIEGRRALGQMREAAKYRDRHPENARLAIVRLVQLHRKYDAIRASLRRNRIEAQRVLQAGDAAVREAS